MSQVMRVNRASNSINKADTPLVVSIFSATVQNLFIAIILFPSALFADEFLCGIAKGYPPYQFQNANNEAIGFDVDILSMVASESGLPLKIHQDEWDNVVGTMTFTDKLHCIGGMEITPRRQQLFDFTPPYYERKIVVFALRSNQKMNALSDLIGQPVTGDDDSSIENLLLEQGVRGDIRIKRTKSKEQSMELLASGFFQAMIAPKAVGLHLAKQQGIKVKIIYQSEHVSPVAIAVPKGNPILLKTLSKGIEKLISQGEISASYQQWFSNDIAAVK